MFCKIYPLMIAVLAMACLSQTGCRNRCNPCSNPYQQPYQQPFQQPLQQQYVPPQGYNYGYNPNANLQGRSQLIPPPPTNSLNIPSLARNNVPGTGSGLLSTGTTAPTAARTAELNRQNGWRASGESSSRSNITNPASDSNSGSATRNTFGQTPSAATSSSVLVRNDNILTNPQSPVANNPAAGRVANASYGTSRVDSPDYRTTAVNETRDATRLPVADASAVRAPSQYYSRATGLQVAQAQPNGYAPGQFVAPQQFPQQIPNAALAQRGFAPGGYAAGQYVQPQAGFNNPNLVVSQATATFDPYSNPSRSADWRNRDPGTGNF